MYLPFPGKLCSACCEYFMMTSSNGNTFRVNGLCEGNSPVTGEFDLRLNKRLRKQSKRRWFETSSRSLWRHYNVEKIDRVILLDGMYAHVVLIQSL